MNAYKSVRDIVIILIVIGLVIFIVNNRNGKSGPVGPATNTGGQAGTMGGSGDTGDTTPVTHGTMQTVLTDGDPVIRLGERWIGKDWLAEESIKFMGDSDPDDEVAMQEAIFMALAKGCSDLVKFNLADEKGIVVNEADLDLQEASFFASEGAEDSLANMNLSVERLRWMWARDEVEAGLKLELAKMMQPDNPNQPIPDEAFEMFIGVKLETAEYEVVDPGFEEIFNIFMEIMTTPAQATGDHGPGDGHNHGELPSEDEGAAVEVPEDDVHAGM